MASVFMTVFLMAVCCSVAARQLRGGELKAFFIPCPLSWLTVVGKGGKTAEKFSDMLHNKSLKLHVYKGFYQGWGNFNNHLF